MPDYYIRTPEQDESRGPFDEMKLQTLGDAGQITENSLYYDETKEEWVPIALNKELCAEVFPQHEGLKLKVGKTEKEMKKAEAKKDPGGLSVEGMLDAADGNTSEKRSIKQKEESFNKSVGVSAPGLGFMMMASAIFLLFPNFEILKTIFNAGDYANIINFPFILLGLFDFIMGLMLFLAVTEVYPLLRGRGMITLGFGIYVGWALADPILMGVSAAAGIGIFLATISKRYSLMLLALTLGIGGNGYLAYLASIGRFTEFFESIVFQLIT
ncbi:MAG: hypothetical protein ACN4GF_12470 [Lentimonas sp.]